MSHNYSNDLAYLRSLVAAPLAYLGVLGPRSRTETLLSDLAADGLTLTPEQAGRLYGPVGLDLGADGPEEVALAVVAEIQAVFAGRAGGHLRGREGPLHERPPDEPRPLAPGAWDGEHACAAEVV
jgi:xanthine dehydrogenase accessory factor